MSRFFSSRYRDLEAYVPGEQPKEMRYIKLNTNESPFPPPASVCEAVAAEALKLPLYPDPECTELRESLAALYGVSKEETFVTNGSDDILNFAFMAFVEPSVGAAFADITYGFYEVFAELHHLPYRKIPLLDDFSLDLDAFKKANEVLFIANPNAPTGLSLSVSQIEDILKHNPNHVVVIDEAYVDFGGESVVPLIHRYSNLLVTQTFSKSRSMAGARLGFGIACKELIADLNTIRFSTNPYNINSATMACGIGTLLDSEYTKQNCSMICKTRENTAKALKDLGFTMTESKANFLFVKSPMISGEAYYEKLKARGVLVRHFKHSRICDYCRVTVGAPDEMEFFLNATRSILEEV